MYCKKNGVPVIIIYDLGTGKFNEISIANDVGEISPSLNQDYRADHLNFIY